MRALFALFSCGVVFLCAAPAFSQGQGSRKISRGMAAMKVKMYDANNDGKITREEYTGDKGLFAMIDKDGDGVITAEELAQFTQQGDQMLTIGEAPSSDTTQEGGEPAYIGVGVKALSDMSAADRYKGEDGGLYGKGQNTPPKGHLETALNEARKIQPLGKDGKPSKDGKVVFLSLGMSNTTMEFQRFQQIIKTVKLPPALIVVDGAQGGKEASMWALEKKDAKAAGGTPWDVLAKRLEDAGVSPLQVQVAWMKQAVGGPAIDGEYPAHIKRYQDFCVTIFQKLKSRYPNVRIVYLSNRIYASNANTPLNPEPYAYEYAYGIRHLILDQIAGKPELNCEPAKGEVKAPLLLWGPDLWANGDTPRKDGLVWPRSDLGGDGTHPGDTGREKVAKMLLHFLQTDPTAKLWFVGE